MLRFMRTKQLPMLAMISRPRVMPIIISIKVKPDFFHFTRIEALDWNEILMTRMPLIAVVDVWLCSIAGNIRAHAARVGQAAVIPAVARGIPGDVDIHLH